MFQATVKIALRGTAEEVKNAPGLHGFHLDAAGSEDRPARCVHVSDVIKKTD